MVGFLIKLIVLPISIILSNYLFGLDYTLAQALLVSAVLAIDGQLMEMLFLRENRLWFSTLLDAAATFLIIYFSQFVLADVAISVWAALGTTLLVTIVEHALHAYLIKSHRVKQTEQ